MARPTLMPIKLLKEAKGKISDKEELKQVNKAISILQGINTVLITDQHLIKKKINMKTKKNGVKLIDVIHLYVGQRIISYVGNFSESDVIKGVVGSMVVFKINDDAVQDSLDLNYKFKKGFEPKLMLRPMSELTKEELKKQGFESHIDWLTHENGDPMKAPYEMVSYCIKQGFDVFGLEKSGQAIYL